MCSYSFTATHGILHTGQSARFRLTLSITLGVLDKCTSGTLWIGRGGVQKFSFQK